MNRLFQNFAQWKSEAEGSAFTFLLAAVNIEEKSDKVLHKEMEKYDKLAKDEKRASDIQ